MSKSKTIEIDKKGLQNFTQNSNQKISKTKPEVLDERPDQLVINEAVKRIITASGDQSEILFNQFSKYLSETQLAVIKEKNILLIQDEVLRYIRTNQHGMPTVTRLAIQTKLSRVTVTKHLKEIFNQELDDDKRQLHKQMFDVILTNIAKKAINGDLKASKLYMDTMIKLEEKEGVKLYIKNQQNNIVVNPDK